jgi:hypothetical protein
MLKLIGLFTILIQISWATSEPQKLFIVSNGKVQTVEFKNLKSIEISALNHHPKFKDLGIIRYKGFKVADILKSVKINPEDAITIVGNTGQFSIELKAKELLTGNNIIATHVNGEEVSTEGNGLQIIYDEITLRKYPKLKERQFWCWWVRSLITDDKFQVKASGKKKALTTNLPWPVPYGISSIGTIEEKLRTGSILRFQKLKVELLNGNEKELITDSKSTFFLANPISNKTGAYSLHQLIEKEGEVQTFVNNLYYVKSVKVIQ